QREQNQSERRRATGSGSSSGGVDRRPAPGEGGGTGAEREHHRFQEKREERKGEAGAKRRVSRLPPAHQGHQAAVDEHELREDEASRALPLLCEDFHNLAEEHEVEERDELTREQGERVVGMRRGQDRGNDDGHDTGSQERSVQDGPPWAGRLHTEVSPPAAIVWRS